MYSKAKFDLDEQNRPIIRLEISKDTSDLRDSVAKQFTQNLQGSCYCHIECVHNNDVGSTWVIAPIKPEYYQNHIQLMKEEIQRLSNHP